MTPTLGVLLRVGRVIDGRTAEAETMQKAAIAIVCKSRIITSPPMLRNGIGGTRRERRQ